MATPSRQRGTPSFARFRLIFFINDSWRPKAPSAAKLGFANGYHDRRPPIGSMSIPQLHVFSKPLNS
jgi:hypothetical protein